MCSICGWLNKERNINNFEFIKMNQIAKYRGPDDEGYLFINSKGNVDALGEDSISLPYVQANKISTKDFFLALGHRRLSIIDLTAQGHQPMQYDDSKFAITFNGEIYNYIEVKNELISKGCIFNTNSDTEVLLAAYMYWGEECVNHLNGMWGFAIWDKQNRKLFCSRDRLGAKPFHYYFDTDNFVFSSEIKQLLQISCIPKKLNEKHMVAQMMWGISDYTEETLFDSIFTLKGGHNLVVQVSGDESDIHFSINIYKYWDIDTKIKKDQEAVGETFDLLENAIEIRTRSDVPIGIMLSGGLDSSCLLAKITEYWKEKGLDPITINTFTSCYKDYPEADEKDFAILANDYCGSNHNIVLADEEDTFSLMRDMIWHSESFVSFGSFGSYITMREVAKTGIKVVLNGQGSDETMFGYERYYAWYLKDVLKTKGPISFIKELNEASKNSRLSRTDLIKYYYYFNLYALRKARCRRRMLPYVTETVLNEFDSNHEVRQYINFNNLSEMQYNEIRGTQLTHILHGDDRGYMAFSMESRVPFIDYRYIESAIRIPEKMKIKNGYTKYLLREHFKERLPAEIIWRKNKMGWQSPQKRWIDRLNKKRVDEIFESPKCDKYFNVKAIRELWSNNPYHQIVGQFLNLELFVREFNLEIP